MSVPHRRSREKSTRSAKRRRRACYLPRRGTQGRPRRSPTARSVHTLRLPETIEPGGSPPCSAGSESSVCRPLRDTGSIQIRRPPRSPERNETADPRGGGGFVRHRQNSPQEELGPSECATGTTPPAVPAPLWPPKASA